MTYYVRWLVKLASAVALMASGGYNIFLGYTNAFPEALDRPSECGQTCFDALDAHTRAEMFLVGLLGVLQVFAALTPGWTWKILLAGTMAAGDGFLLHLKAIDDGRLMLNFFKPDAPVDKIWEYVQGEMFIMLAVVVLGALFSMIEPRARASGSTAEGAGKAAGDSGAKRESGGQKEERRGEQVVAVEEEEEEEEGEEDDDDSDE